MRNSSQLTAESSLLNEVFLSDTDYVNLRMHTGCVCVLDMSEEREKKRKKSWLHQNFKA